METASMVLLSYNQENYIHDAINSCLNQKGSPMQIIISDDCSSDATHSIIKKVVSNYRGKHELVINRNSINLGLIGNFNTAIGMARGENIIVAAGDDISLKYRAQKSLQIINGDKRVICVSMALECINKLGHPVNSKKNVFGKIAHLFPARPYGIKNLVSNNIKGLSGASRCFRRSAWDFFGPISENCPTEDSTTLLRCLILGTAYASPAIGVKYRVHDENISSESGLRRMDLDEILKQYTADIFRARSGGIINALQEKELYDWAINNMEARVKHLYREVYSDSNNSKNNDLIPPLKRSILSASRQGQEKVSQKILNYRIQNNEADFDARLALIVLYLEENDLLNASIHKNKLEEYKAPDEYHKHAMDLIKKHQLMTRP
jgi:glycosyltransferase involved in cell wall biosynthesis